MWFVQMGSEEFSLLLRFFFVFLRFFFLFFLRFSSFFFVFSLTLLEDRRKQLQLTAQNGEFHSDPMCTDPVQNFPKSFLS